MSNRFDESPTTPAAQALSPALERNIQSIMARRRKAERLASAEEHAAAAISRFAGSMTFVYIHLVLFGGWIIANCGLIPLLPRWDPSLVVLAMIASVEAIFLSTFVLINQNRMASEDNARAELDLQISLLNEHETTKLITMVEALTRHLKIETAADGEVEELERDIAPDAVLDTIERAEQQNRSR
jgi:uncharacterized membrane protein